MTPEEYMVETEYLERNYDLWLNMTYEPLWVQKLPEEEREKYWPPKAITTPPSFEGLEL